MKQLAIVIIILSIHAGSVFCQSANPFFIGIQPNITVEPFYEEGELDIDIFPLVFEASVGLRTDIKLTPIVNYHIGGVKQGISDITLFTVVPVFFKSKEEKTSKPYGLYVGPVLGFGRNMLNNHYTTTLAMEPGYMFETKKSFTIAFGIQIGGSYFSYDSNPNKWVSHWGPKISFGFWL